MSSSLRVYTVLALVVCALTLGLGIVIGYFIQASAETLLLPKDQRACDIGYGSHLPQVQRFLERNIIEACAAETCDIPLPRIYVSEHLYDEQIVVDGLLDETAWAQAPWSEKFVDLEGRSDKIPLLNTRVKLRWDDSRLYIGALLEGSHVWANRTQHDSDVFNDNAFEVFLDSFGSFHKYKEIGINALGTVWDVLLLKAYIDGGEPLPNWESLATSAIYTDGEVNNAQIQGHYWSVEMSLPFTQLLVGSNRVDIKPFDKEIWYVNFARSEIPSSVHGDHYHTIPNTQPRWWSWNPTGAYNLHLPNRWGLLQFRKRSSNETSMLSFIPDRYRHIYHTLSVVFEAMHKYRALFGHYVNNLSLLDLPPYIMNRKCIPRPEITLDWRGFVVSLTPDEPGLESMHIRADRFVWFGHIDKLGKNY